MNYQEAIDYLDAHIGAGMQPGLERIRLLVESMGSPHEGYPLIHIAGTNGKTSTTRMAALLLVAHGLSTGTFISPHLERIEERWGINGRVATAEEFAQAVTDVAAFADLLESRGEVRFSYFELNTAMAFAFFADQAVQAAVVEVGLGGRLDATNVIDADVAVLTGVGIDHQEYLGTTVEAIAGEKLAITKPGSILVTGPLPDPVVPLAEEKARDLGVQIRMFGRDFGVDAAQAVGGWTFDIQGAEADYEDVYLPVHGRHQTVNAAVAVAAVEALMGRSLNPAAVIEAAAVFTSPGRMESVAAEPLVLLDGAHNPDGFATLDKALEEEFPTTVWTLVIGVMEDKDVGSMIGHIADRIGRVIATSVDMERALPAGRLADEIRKLVSVPVEDVGDPVGAVEVAVRQVGSDGAVLVAGSLYVAGAVRPYLRTESG